MSLTSVICKVLESFIRDSIQDFFEKQDLYTTCQHGFRRARSCVSQLLEVVDDFSSLVDQGQSFDVIYLDFKKAFDSVPHQRLLLKLQAYGITGNILLWIEDFLLNRVQTVKVGNDYSESSPVLSGIPQGSVLGPTLFTIFINDLLECAESFCKIFADDTKVYNVSTKHCQIQNDLDKIHLWSQTCQLPFNAAKCKCMYLGHNNPKNAYFLNKIKICECEEEKDLGATFDPTLKFKIHINNIVSKGNQVLGLIKRNFDYLDKDSLVLL